MGREMSKSKFPLTISAVQKRDRSLWEIGDALVAECGAPSEGGANDGSWELMQAVAAEIESIRIEGYSVKFLQKLRHAANEFPPTARRATASWSAHHDAGSREMFDAIVKASPDKKVSRDYVREMRDQIEQQQAVELEDDDADKRPPVRKPTPEQAQQAATQVSINRALHQLTGMIAGAESTVDTATRIFEDNSEHFVPEAFDALVEQALTVANKWREFSTKVSRSQPKKRGHLAAVS